VDGQLRLPSLLHASKEARREGLKYYTLCLEKSLFEEGCDSARYISISVDRFKHQRIERLCSRGLHEYNFDPEVLKTNSVSRLRPQLPHQRWIFDKRSVGEVDISYHGAGRSHCLDKWLGKIQKREREGVGPAHLGLVASENRIGWPAKYFIQLKLGNQLSDQVQIHASPGRFRHSTVASRSAAQSVFRWFDFFSLGEDPSRLRRYFMGAGQGWSVESETTKKIRRWILCKGRWGEASYIDAWWEFDSLEPWDGNSTICSILKTSQGFGGKIDVTTDGSVLRERWRWLHKWHSTRIEEPEGTLKNSVLGRDLQSKRMPRWRVWKVCKTVFLISACVWLEPF